MTWATSLPRHCGLRMLRNARNIASFVGLYAIALSPVSADVTEIHSTLTYCSSCHGLQGEGIAALQAPAIAGQRESYLREQMLAFREGFRGANPEDEPGRRMASASAGLEDALIDELASYYGAMPATPPAKNTPLHNTSADRAHRGRQLYVTNCAQCHGPDARGFEQLGTPSLRQLGPAYQLRQMKNYEKGLRGSALAGSGIRAQWMRSIVSQIANTDDLEDIIFYIVTEAHAPHARPIVSITETRP